jgi:hypothetical protein
MDNVQNCESYINIPTSQTHNSYLVVYIFIIRVIYNTKGWKKSTNPVILSIVQHRQNTLDSNFRIYVLALLRPGCHFKGVN